MLAHWSMRGKIETLMNMVKSLFLAGLLEFAPGSVSAQDVAPAPQTATAAPAGAATDSAPAAAASVPALKPVEGIGMPRPGRSEEDPHALQSPMRNSFAGLCLKKKTR